VDKRWGDSGLLALAKKDIVVGNKSFFENLT
jgi:hypothetical protein